MWGATAGPPRIHLTTIRQLRAGRTPAARQSASAVSVMLFAMVVSANDGNTAAMHTTAISAAILPHIGFLFCTVFTPFSSLLMVNAFGQEYKTCF